MINCKYLDTFKTSKDKIQIVVLEDNPYDLELTVNQLNTLDFELDIIQTTDKISFENCIIDNKPDLVIADYRIPGYDGAAAFNFTKHKSNTPFIFVTGSIGEELAVECLRNGADDFILKNKLDLLPFSVIRILESYKMKKELGILRDEIQDLEFSKRNKVIEIVEQISYGVSGSHEETFFVDLVKRLSSTLNVKYSYVTQRVHDSLTTVETVAFVDDQKLIDNFEYELAGSPCEDSLTSGFNGISKNIISKYPDLLYLKELKAESYLGVALKSSKGDIIGSLAVIDSKPIEDMEFSRSILKIFSTRASAELERLLTSKKLRQSEKLYRSLVENANVGITLTDITTKKIIMVNDASAKIIGYSRDDMAGMSVYDILERVHPDEREEVAKSYNALFQGQSAENKIDFRILNTDGDYRWSSTRTMFVDIDGSRILMDISHDITQKKRALDTLTESETKYKNLFNASEDAIILMRDLEIMDCNPKASEIFACKKTDLLGKSPIDYSPNDQNGIDKDQKVKIIRELIQEENQINFDWIHSKMDGTLMDVEVRLSKINFAEKLYFQAIIRDVTEKKKLKKVNEQRTQLIQSAAESSNVLLTNPDDETALLQAVEILGKKNKLDRCYIFKNSFEDPANLSCTMLYEWFSNKKYGTSKFGSAKNASYSELGMGRWLSEFQKGNSIDGNINDFPKPEHKFLASQNILSIAVVPIFIDNLFWGFLGMDSCESARSWNPDELSMLRTIAVGIGSFIHKNKMTEALRNNESFTKGILNSLTSLIAVVENTGNIMAVNDGWKEASLLNNAWIIGGEVNSNYYQILDSNYKKGCEFSQNLKNGIQTLFNSDKRIFHIEYPMHTDHRVQWFIVRVSRMEIGQGYAVVSQQEITAIKHAEDELRISEERLDLAIKGADLAMWEWDIEKDVAIYNQRWYEMLGYDYEDNLNEFSSRNSWEDLIHPEDIDFVNEKLKLHLEGKTDHYESEQRLRTKSGTYKWILKKGRAFIRDNRYQAKRMSGTLLDIDERKAAERALQQLTNELILSNNELEQFAYVASHNLRSPVANLIGLMGLYDSVDPLNIENPQVMKRMNQSLNYLHITLNDLIKMLVEKKTLNDDIIQVSFQQVLDSVIHSIETQVLKSNVVFNVDFAMTPTMVYPQSHIQSILLNLITNAIKYRAPERDPLIEIKTTKESGMVIISVKDNGLGIDLAKYKEKLFGFYQRFHERIEGKGLGLFIIKSQVEAHGGKIEVESEVGIGTTFHISLKDYTV